MDQVPAGYNPLTGLPVSDPSVLELPAVLISITNFPKSARPQAGLSFAPTVYEMYITEGTTRFLVTFYGEYPKTGSFIKGTCQPPSQPFFASETTLGNRVWEDANANGLQDAWENGIADVCVDLINPTTGETLQSTSTDSNGYFGFNVEAQQEVQLKFTAPEGAAFTLPNVANEDQDSDADPASGLTDLINASGNNDSIDAGFILSNPATADANSNQTLFATEVGPVRSARDSFIHFSGFYQDSCLVYASADAAVLARLPQCAMQFGSEEGNINSAMLDVTRMQTIAEQSKNPAYDFNYAANLFSERLPAGGLPAEQIDVFYSYFNQQRWVFDPLSGAYLRYEDEAENNPPSGEIPFHPSLERLTGQQLAFENIIVLYAQHDVISPTRINIQLGIGQQGYAVLFRDGQLFKIRWSTVGGDYEKSTGLRRPIQFTDESGNPIALKPGQTWVHIVTPYSTLKETNANQWRLRFFAPAGTK